MYFTIFTIAAVIALQAFVTFRVHRSEIYDKAQKRAQTKLIWLLPALGAAIAFSVLQQEESAMKQSPYQHERK